MRISSVFALLVLATLACAFDFTSNEGSCQTVQLPEGGRYVLGQHKERSLGEISLFSDNGFVARLGSNPNERSLDTLKCVLISGSAESDRLVIDWESYSTLGLPLLFEGNDQTTEEGDVLEWINLDVEELELTHHNANDGEFFVNGDLHVAYRGLEPLVIQGVTIQKFVINMPDQDNDATLIFDPSSVGSPNRRLILDAPTFESTTFETTFDTLRITGGRGNDVLSIGGLSLDLATNSIDIDLGEGYDTVIFSPMLCANFFGCTSHLESLTIRSDYIFVQEHTIRSQDFMRFEAEISIFMTEADLKSFGDVLLLGNVQQTSTLPFEGVHIEDSTVDAGFNDAIHIEGNGGKVFGSYFLIDQIFSRDVMDSYGIHEVFRNLAVLSAKGVVLDEIHINPLQPDGSVSIIGRGGSDTLTREFFPFGNLALTPRFKYEDVFAHIGVHLVNEVTIESGDLTIRGHGGESNFGVNQFGVLMEVTTVELFAGIQTASEFDGAIVIEGYGGNSVGALNQATYGSMGVVVNWDNRLMFHAEESISIFGYGGESYEGFNHGILFTSADCISGATILTSRSDNGDITIHGEGGVTTGEPFSGTGVFNGVEYQAPGYLGPVGNVGTSFLGVTQNGPVSCNFGGNLLEIVGGTVRVSGFGGNTLVEKTNVGTNLIVEKEKFLVSHDGVSIVNWEDFLIHALSENITLKGVGGSSNLHYGNHGLFFNDLNSFLLDSKLAVNLYGTSGDNRITLGPNSFEFLNFNNLLTAQEVQRLFPYGVIFGNIEECSIATDLEDVDAFFTADFGLIQSPIREDLGGNDVAQIILYSGFWDYTAIDGVFDTQNAILYNVLPDATLFVSGELLSEVRVIGGELSGVGFIGPVNNPNLQNVVTVSRGGSLNGFLDVNMDVLFEAQTILDFDQTHIAAGFLHASNVADQYFALTVAQKTLPMFINGSLTLSSTTTLTADIHNPSDFDQIFVNGDIDLSDATLIVNPLLDFDYVKSSQFKIIDGNSILTGSFNNRNVGELFKLTDLALWDLHAGEPTEDEFTGADVTLIPYQKACLVDVSVTAPRGNDLAILSNVTFTFDRHINGFEIDTIYGINEINQNGFDVLSVSGFDNSPTGFRTNTIINNCLPSDVTCDSWTIEAQPTSQSLWVEFTDAHDTVGLDVDCNSFNFNLDPVVGVHVNPTRNVFFAGSSTWVVQFYDVDTLLPVEVFGFGSVRSLSGTFSGSTGDSFEITPLDPSNGSYLVTARHECDGQIQLTVQEDVVFDLNEAQSAQALYSSCLLNLFDNCALGSLDIA